MPPCIVSALNGIDTNDKFAAPPNKPTRTILPRFLITARFKLESRWIY